MLALLEKTVMPRFLTVAIYVALLHMGEQGHHKKNACLVMTPFLS
jgi:hypothetical protein